MYYLSGSVVKPSDKARLPAMLKYFTEEHHTVPSNASACLNMVVEGDSDARLWQMYCSRGVVGLCPWHDVSVDSETHSSCVQKNIPEIPSPDSPFLESTTTPRNSTSGRHNSWSRIYCGYFQKCDII